MSHLQLSPSTENGPKTIGAIGGRPHLPSDTDWPTCRMCGENLVAFLDIVLPNAKCSDFAEGSRLQVFGCYKHDDIAGTIYTDYEPFENASQTSKLPAEYWNISDGHYLHRLLPANQSTTAANPEDRLLVRALNATEAADLANDTFPPSDVLQLFGKPCWLQEPEEHTCACGAPMMVLLQVPEGFAFAMADGAPEQANSFSATDYTLFMGSQLTLLGCVAQCHPQALWPVVQG